MKGCLSQLWSRLNALEAGTMAGNRKSYSRVPAVYPTAVDRVDDTFMNFTGRISAGAEPPRRHGGECFGKAVVSFAPTSASGCTNEAFAANYALGDASRCNLHAMPANAVFV